MAYMVSNYMNNIIIYKLSCVYRYVYAVWEKYNKQTENTF